MHELNGKSAVITGASKGIGAATAYELANLGVSVILAARSTEQIESIAHDICEKGGQAKAIACDVCEFDQVEAAINLCISSYGKIDILVNNAGMIEPITLLAESDPEAWMKVADVNFKGVYYGLRAAIPHMEKQGSGSIVNVSSGAAHSVMEGWSHYCAAKSAAYVLTQAVDLEYREKGIQVIGISPGTVATDMQIAIKASGINPVSELDPSVHIPAEWPAKAIVWLCTKEASSFSGQDYHLKKDDNLKRLGLVT